MHDRTVSEYGHANLHTEKKTTVALLHTESNLIYAERTAFFFFPFNSSLVLSLQRYGQRKPELVTVKTTAAICNGVR